MLHIHLCFRCTQNFSPLHNLSMLYTSTVCLRYTRLCEGSVPVQSQNVNLNDKWTKMLENISKLWFTLWNLFRRMSFSVRQVWAWAMQMEWPRAEHSVSQVVYNDCSRLVSRQMKSVLSQSTHMSVHMFNPM